MKLKILRIVSLIVVVVASLLHFSGALNLLRMPSTVQAVGDLSVDWGVPEGNPIFTVSDFAPGQMEARSVIVTNNAPTTRPVGIRAIETSDLGNLAGQLEVTISDGSADLYGGTTGTKTLDQFFSDSILPSFVPLTTLSSGSSETYSITVKFKETAGNEFQNQSVVFDLKIGIGFELPAECENMTFAGSPIFGTSNSETIRGTTGSDLILGLEGNDRIFGFGGNDCIIGGEGNDELRGETGNDKLVGGEGNDLLIGAVGNDQIVGNSGNDQIRGENGNDILDGGDGNDQITGGNGNDIISGGDGNDKIKSENGNDQVTGDSGNDTLDGGAGNDTLTGGAGSDTANGQSGTDTCDAEGENHCEL